MKGRMFRLLAIMALGFALPGQGFALDPQVQSIEITRSQLPWSDTRTYQDCGQRCTIEKANETISVQALYVINHINDIQAAYKGEQYDKVTRELRPYCTDKQGSGSDAARNCLQNYIAIQVPILRTMRSAIVKNSTILSKYVPSKQLIARMTPKTRKNQNPYVPRKAELDKQYATEKTQLDFLGSENYVKWVQNETPHCPSQSDFYVTKKVQNPAGPAGDLMTVYDTGPNGAPRLDAAGQAAFQKEYQTCQKLKKELQSVFDVKATPPTPDPRNATQMQTQAYQDARNSFVQVANTPDNNQNALKTGVATATYPGAQQRNPASNPTKVDANGDAILVEPPSRPGISYDRPVLLDSEDLNKVIANLNDPGFIDH